MINIISLSLRDKNFNQDKIVDILKTLKLKVRLLNDYITGTRMTKNAMSHTEFLSWIIVKNLYPSLPKISYHRGSPSLSLACTRATKKPASSLSVTSTL